MEDLDLIQYRENIHKIIDFYSKTIDTKKIINNILNGQEYIKLTFFIDENNRKLYLEMYKTNIPSFNSISFYIPFLNNFDIKNYQHKYKELSLLNIIEEDRMVFTLDIESTIENLMNYGEFKTSIHDIEIKNPKTEFLNNYNLIINYIKRFYSSNKSEGIGFILNLSLDNESYFLEKVNDVSYYKDTNIYFDLDNNFDSHLYELLFLDCLHLVQYNPLYSTKYSKFARINKNIAIESIKLMNNIENF